MQRRDSAVQMTPDSAEIEGNDSLGFVQKRFPSNENGMLRPRARGGLRMKGISFAILTILLMVTGVRAAEVEVLKPKGNLEMKLGHPSTISLYDMPAVLTHERLNRTDGI